MVDILALKEFNSKTTSVTRIFISENIFAWYIELLCQFKKNLIMPKNFQLGKCDYLQQHLFGLIDFFLNRQSNSIYQANTFCEIIIGVHL